MVRQHAATKRLLNCLRARTGYNLYVTDCQLTLLTYKSVLSWHATDFFSRCCFWLLVCGFPFSSMPSNLAELPRNWCSYAPSSLTIEQLSYYCRNGHIFFYNFIKHKGDLWLCWQKNDEAMRGTSNAACRRTTV